MRPELVGRIDEKLVFARLGPDVQREICALEVAREIARLRAGGFDLEVSREALGFLMREGFHPHHSAHPKTVERQLQNAVVRELSSTGCTQGRVVPDEAKRRLLIRRE